MLAKEVERTTRFRVAIVREALVERRGVSGGEDRLIVACRLERLFKPFERAMRLWGSLRLLGLRVLSEDGYQTVFNIYVGLSEPVASITIEYRLDGLD